MTGPTRAAASRGVLRLAWRGACRAVLVLPVIIGTLVATWLAVEYLALPQADAVRSLARNMSFHVEKRGERLVLLDARSPLWVDLADMGQGTASLIQFQEDRQFLHHRGMDGRGVARALLHNLLGKGLSGGSTITQQLAKNLLLTGARSWRRKLREPIAATWMEIRFSKQELLELYLNVIYFGEGAYGIEAAARHFLGKRARDLNPLEAAVLVTSVPLPNRRNINADRDGAVRRAVGLLQRMQDAGQLAGVDIGALKLEPGYRQLHTLYERGIYDALLPELRRRLRGLEDGRYVVVSTVDPELQTYAELAVARSLQAYRGRNVSQAALASLDEAGRIRALVGTADHRRSTLNHALQARRQIGSVIKPFIYLAALENGDSPDTPVSARPVRIGDWSPRNDNGEYPPSLTYRQALSHSYNTAAVRVLERTGAPAVRDLARAFALDCRLPDDPGLALGTGECSLLSVTNGFATLMRLGRRLQPGLIAGIRNSRARFVYQPGLRRGRQVASRRGVRQLNAMLHQVVDNGTGRQAGLSGIVAAGKTGTTQDYRDAWFIGFTRQLATGVWVGNPANEPMRRITGGSLPAGIWREYMRLAVTGLGLDSSTLPGAVAPDA